MSVQFAPPVTWREILAAKVAEANRSPDAVTPMFLFELLVETTEDDFSLARDGYPMVSRISDGPFGEAPAHALLLVGINTARRPNDFSLDVSRSFLCCRSTFDPGMYGVADFGLPVLESSPPPLKVETWRDRPPML